MDSSEKVQPWYESRGGGAIAIFLVGAFLGLIWMGVSAVFGLGETEAERRLRESEERSEFVQLETCRQTTMIEQMRADIVEICDGTVRIP